MFRVEACRAVVRIEINCVTLHLVGYTSILEYIITLHGPMNLKLCCLELSNIYGGQSSKVLLTGPLL